jgi:hypothetical protein
MKALAPPLLSAAKRGRPASEAPPRNCVAYARLTETEYNALLSLVPPRGSLSDLCRELLNEAALHRLRASERAASIAAAG